MDKKIQQQKAEVFLALHKTPPLLVLPNAWDAVSARLFEIEGFKAVGTTSAGIAPTLGYPDMERVSREEMAGVVSRISRSIRIPLSADMEAGYGKAPEEVAKTTGIFLETGAVGVNLEDGTGDPTNPLFDRLLQCQRIAAVRERAINKKIPLLINARIDTYLTTAGDLAGCLRRTIDRANAFHAVGADCIFVPTPLDKPGLLDRSAIRDLVGEIQAPLNLLGGSVAIPLAELEEIGVARISLGPGPMRATLALLRKISRELLGAGTYTNIMEDTIPYGEVNAWFDQREG